jgi:D-3-phosphoglycerate dehydrogenase
MKALVTANVDDDNLHRLRTDLGFDVTYRPMADREDRFSPAQLRGMLADVDVFVVGYEGVSPEVLDAAQELEVIACARGGPEANVDIGAATERGIPVLYAPGRNAVSVADFTLGLVVAVARNIAHSHHLLRGGVYTGAPQADTAPGGEREDVTWGVGKGSPYVELKGPELYGKQLGLVGFGAIGREVAKRAQGFGMDVVAHDPYVDAEEMREAGVRKSGLEEVCHDSTFVSVHCPVTESTRGLIGPEEFELMGEDAFFINTARAAIIDQTALVEQLRSGSLRGAALDVYEREPLPDDHPLLELDNVVTTPHLGGAAEEVIARHSETLVDDLERLLSGEQPSHVANPETVAAAAGGDD